MYKKKFFGLINLLLINYIYCTIVLPLDTLPRENYELTYDINSPKDIMDQENRNSFFTTFEIGFPVQKVPLIIKPKLNYYVITSVFPVPNITISKNHKNYNFPDDFFNKYDFYNENKSNSSILNWCRETEYYNAEECCSVNDTILFYTDVNMENKIVPNINFELMRNVEDNITGEIGLNLYDEVGRTYNTFLGILKNNDLIKDYNWYFDFDAWNNKKGKIVIGSLPHEDYPDIYSEDDLFYTPSIQLSRLSYMEMRFDTVYINNKDDKIFFNTLAELRYDTNIIIGDNIYEKYILSKIDNLLEQQKCFNDTFKDYEHYFNFTFYYCLNDKNIKRKLNEILPPIYFYCNDFNHTFELKINELLFEKDKYIYIPIIFNDITRKWSLGKVFSLKYKFVFNQDKKEIGFYNTNYLEEKNETKNYMIYIKIIIFVVLSIIFLFLGIKIGKMLNKSRKKRANELTDDYEYYSDSNNENNINHI